MCLAIPMKIIELSNNIANCEAAGVRREVSVQLLLDQTIEVGDYILVHLGYAIQKIPAPDAVASRKTYDDMRAALALSKSPRRGKDHA
ncbi:Hydrogenase maturation protein HypC [Alteromonadaceae bacterium Bs31]|nr:Hydrogenase maturation protein HypC [Alteromonadaceae bacterium Bs31]